MNLLYNPLHIFNNKTRCHPILINSASLTFISYECDKVISKRICIKNSPHAVFDGTVFIYVSVIKSMIR